MEIGYFGWQSFRIQEGKSAVITQPFSSKRTGILFPKIKADVVLQVAQVAAKDNAKGRITPLTRKDVFYVCGPGEYEIGGIDVRGFPGGYWFKMGNLELVFWWQWELKMIKKFAENFPTTDVLFLKGDKGGEGFARKIKQTVETISPAVTIPFCSASVSKEDLKTCKWAEPFLDALDREDIRPVEKLSISKEELAAEDLKVVLLRPRI